MRTKNLLAWLAAILLIAHVQITVAQTADKKQKDTPKIDNWVLLDSHVVDYTLDRDVVALKDSQAFTALKFKVNNGPINLHKCTVHFANGETQDVSFTTDVNDGRLIDLYGNTRTIEKITFWYDTKNSADKKAVVEVWGKKGEQG
jgi:hypothetical protein